MPTIALINGHAFAGGFMTAMYHDYRVQNPQKGFLCLNEIALGIPLTPPMRSVFIEKIQDGPLLRSIILEGRRFTGPQALEAGIVDALGGLPETIQLIHERGLLQIVKSPSFVPLKERLWSRVSDSIDNLSEHDASDERRGQRTEATSAEAKNRVEQWEGKKSKL
jgi:Delta3-Delta2-enoyl-CoA isomerase